MTRAWPCLPIRCTGCARVLCGSAGTAGLWVDHPGLIAGEGPGRCVTCGVEDEARRQRGLRATDDAARLARRLGKTFGPATGDPFAGFREEGNADHRKG